MKGRTDNRTPWDTCPPPPPPISKKIFGDVREKRREKIEKRKLGLKNTNFLRKRTRNSNTSQEKMLLFRPKIAIIF